MTNNEDNIELYQEEKLPTFLRLIRTIKIMLFYAVLILVIIIDMWVFTLFHDWGSAISILVLELILLAVLARHTHIDYIEILTDKILSSTKNK